MDDAASLQRAIGDEVAAPAPRRRRDGWRLWVLLVAALLLPAAILGTGAWSAWRLTWTEIERGLMRGADINADYVARNLQSLARTAGRIADAAARIETLPSAAERAAEQDLVLDMVREQPLVRAVTAFGASGQQLLHVATSPEPGGAGDLLDGGIREALAQAPPGRIAVGHAYRQGGGPLLAMGLRSLPAGTTVVFVLDAAEIGEALGRHTDSDSDIVTLVRIDGQILARRPPFVDPPPPLGPGQPTMGALAEGQTSGTLMSVTRDGIVIALAFTRIGAIPDLAIVVGRPRAEILGRWRQDMVPLLLVGLPAVLALMGLTLVVRRKQDELEVALDGLEQRVAQRTDSLREGEERLRLALEAGQLGTWETDLRTNRSTRSPRTIEILGLQPDVSPAPLEGWSARLHPHDRRRVLDSWDRLASGLASTYRAEYRLLRPDGAWRWLESTGAVARADPKTGQPLRLAGTVQDITERREAEERRDLLTQEVNHRARNTLAIVQAILRLTQADTPAEFSRLVEGRIAALARAQSLLAAERWTGAPLATLIADELAPFIGTAEGRFQLEGPAFRIRAEAVHALSMVFHELATNATKHGALSVPDGRLSVAWAVNEAAAVLRIRWTESGGPSPGLPTRRGVGSRVIEATVAGQLGGAVDRRWPDEGLICDIVLPLARARAGPG